MASDEENVKALMREIQGALEDLYILTLDEADAPGIKRQRIIDSAAQHIRRLGYIRLHGIEGVESQNDSSLGVAGEESASLAEMRESVVDAFRELNLEESGREVVAALDELERLRAREAALVEIVRAVASLDRMEIEDGTCPFCGLVDWEDRDAPHISRFGRDCPVAQARALLAAPDATAE